MEYSPRSGNYINVLCCGCRILLCMQENQSWRRRRGVHSFSCILVLFIFNSKDSSNNIVKVLLNVFLKLSKTSKTFMHKLCLHQLSVRLSRLKQLIALRLLINLQLCEFVRPDKTFTSHLYLIYKRSPLARVCISDEDRLLMFYLLLMNKSQNVYFSTLI